MAEALSDRAGRARQRAAVGPALLRAALLAALSSGLLGSCLRLNWNRQTIHVPIPDQRLEELAPGDELARCLELLGAPLLVRELGEGAAALVYGWLDQEGWGLNVSVPVGDRLSASFDYDQVDSRARGILVLVDAERRLVAARQGALRDLLAQVPRPRPAFDPRWDGSADRD